MSLISLYFQFHLSRHINFDENFVLLELKLEKPKKLRCTLEYYTNELVLMKEVLVNTKPTRIQTDDMRMQKRMQSCRW